MRRTLARLATAGLALALCGASAAQLARGRLSARNHALLEQLLAEAGRRDQGPGRPYVVCDWDNTSAFGDVEETLAYFMADTLAYALSPAAFERAARLGVPTGPTRLVDAAGRPVVFEDLLSDLVDDYAFLHASFAGLGGTRTLEEVRATEEHRDFVARLFVLFDAIEAAAGTARADLWQGQLMTGTTSEKLEELSERSIRKNLGAEIRKVPLSGSRTLVRRSGQVFTTTSQGLRIHPDMGSLYQALMRAGVDVYVVSASPEELVVPFATKAEYGYGIPRDHVLGVRFAKEGGVLQPELAPGRAMTWGPGKVELIRTLLVPRHGQDPLVVFGDSDGDADMLSAFPGTRLGFIVNRLKGGKIGALCQEAARQRSVPRPRYVLQGVDESTGLFDADEGTVKPGTTGKVLLH